MANRTSKHADIVKGILGRFPDHPSLTLAKILFKDFPDYFKSVGNARKAISYYRGANGKKNSKHLADRRFVKEKGIPGNPFNLPASFERDYSPIAIQGKKIGVLSDIHIPYHNIPALTCAMEWLKREKVDTILLNGDIMDFYQLSDFDRDRGAPSIKDELEQTRQFLDSIEKNFPDARIYFREGNHEERLKRYLMTKAPELFGMAEFQLPVLLDFMDRGIEWVHEKRLMTAGKLNTLHGHEYKAAMLAPVNPARGFFLRAKDHILVGHHHQTSTHNEPTVGGKIIGAWSVGCLCELHPYYMPLNKWNHGAAIIELDQSTGDFEVHNRTIIKGKIH